MPRADAIEALKPIGEEIVLAALQEELGKLGVHFDRWFREQSLYDDGLVDLVLQKLRAKATWPNVTAPSGSSPATTAPRTRTKW